MTNLKTFGVALLTLLIASVAGAAGPVGTTLKGDYKQTVALWTSDYGNEIKSFGYCTVMHAQGTEMIGVRVFVDLPDDTNLIVTVTNDKGTFEIGTIKMFLGSGSLVLYSGIVPSPAFPLEYVKEVAVHDIKGQLMSYSWVKTSIK